MKRTILYLLFFVSFIQIEAQEKEIVSKTTSINTVESKLVVRPFSLKNGRKIRAQIFSYNKKTKIVALRKVDLKIINKELSEFSKEDKQFILEWENLNKSFTSPKGRRYKEIIEDKYPNNNVFVGATSGFLEATGPISQLLSSEFRYITPANEFKQTHIHPEPGVWNWDFPDEWIEFAEKNNQLVRIHGPISPQCSKWAMNDERKPEELEQNLQEFMTALCRRYNGKKNVVWMDVVNETVNPDGTWKQAMPGITWEVPWEKMGYIKTPSTFKHLGDSIPKYIVQAFQIANKEAPDIKLVLNQHLGMEEAAWNKVKDMVLYLRSIGLRVDGIGWQAHIKLIKDDPSQWETNSVNTKELSELISWAHQNDLEFHVTENNIHVKPENENKVEEQAPIFSGIVKTLLEHRHTGVVTWNIWSIQNTDHTRARIPKVKIGLWNRQLEPTQSYYEVQKLLENPPVLPNEG
ncbi:endo-1,4-beta-xylanase [Flammeovirga sp. SubArs3]|uniref:endo-1,4-beta-xylanase n=1 Tax=Flammeovirga sp. SubArs3 TaxID=2995316 RepID=UPI00248BAFCF|nr:endo-1,4-beta-xylanase [Flammeovirga sp. SubArs3]